MTSYNFQVVVKNLSGLHARPASELVSLVLQFKSQVIIKYPESNLEAYGNSVLSILSLGCEQSSVLYFTVDGDDAESLSEKIKLFFESSFGETG